MRSSSIAPLCCAVIVLGSGANAADASMLLASVERSSVQTTSGTVVLPGSINYRVSRNTAPIIVADYLTIPVSGPSDFGVVHVVNELNTSDWSDLNWLMTNGENNSMSARVNGTGSLSTFVSVATQATFFGFPVGEPNLAGYVLTSVEVELLNLVFISPGANGSGSTDIAHTTRYRFYGEPIPAPGALSLAACAGLAAARRRRR